MKVDDRIAECSTALKLGDDLNIRRGSFAVPALFQVVRYLLSLGQTGDAGALQRRNVDESVLGAILGLNETEAFVGIEEFDCTFDHG